MLALAAGGVISVTAGAHRGAPTTARVTSVTTGDTLQVRLANGKRHKLHVLGVSAPPSGSCFANEAAAAGRTLALNQTVKLSGVGPTAYVTLPDGSDLGKKLIANGSAEIDAWGRRSHASRPTCRCSKRRRPRTAASGERAPPTCRSS